VGGRSPSSGEDATGTVGPGNGRKCAPLSEAEEDRAKGRNRLKKNLEEKKTRDRTLGKKEREASGTPAGIDAGSKKIGCIRDVV